MARKYGWKPDVPDRRDRYLLLRPKRAFARNFDLRSGFPIGPFDQGPIGSCTAQMAKALMQFDEKKQRLPVHDYAAMYMYYNSRLLEGSTGYDAGATIRDAFKSVKLYGACHEQTWPYRLARLTVKPRPAAYIEGGQHRVLAYSRVPQSEVGIKTALSAGFPVGIGISVYESFETVDVERTGTVPMPGTDEQFLGGHAVVICGWLGRLWLLRNSWGSRWGMGGYFTLPKEYLLNTDLAADAWTATLVSA